MFGHARLAAAASFLALLGPALAANLYRMDDRTPASFKSAGGIQSWNPSGTGSVIDHVKAKLGKDDPWVSTTNSKSLAAAGAKSPGTVYVYYIDPTGLKPVDTVKEFAKAKEEHPHPNEKEFSIKGSIPWKNVASWDTYVRGKKTTSTTRAEFEKSPSPQPESSKAGSKSPSPPPAKKQKTGKRDSGVEFTA